MIQEGINQILSNFGVIAALGDKPGLQAMADKRAFKTAKASIKDIRGNLESGKTYEPEELKNIESRISKNVSDIYDLKTKELGGGVYGRIVGSESQHYKHAEIKEDLKAIENLKKNAQSKIDQKERLDELKDLIKNNANVSGKQVRETMHVLRRTFREDTDGTK